MDSPVQLYSPQMFCELSSFDMDTDITSNKSSDILFGGNFDVNYVKTGTKRSISLASESNSDNEWSFEEFLNNQEFNEYDDLVSIPSIEAEEPRQKVAKIEESHSSEIGDIPTIMSEVQDVRAKIFSEMDVTTLNFFKTALLNIVEMIEGGMDPLNASLDESTTEFTVLNMTLQTQVPVVTPQDTESDLFAPFLAAMTTSKVSGTLAPGCTPQWKNSVDLLRTVSSPSPLNSLFSPAVF